MKTENIQELTNLIEAKVEIWKLKADDYTWACRIDETTKERVLHTLNEIEMKIAKICEKSKED